MGKSERLQGIRGVFADQDIKKGELIEECPVILVPIQEIERVWPRIFYPRQSAPIRVQSFSFRGQLR